MPVKPKILKMEVEDTASGVAWTAAAKKNFGDLMAIMPVGCVYALHQASAVTDAVTHEQMLAEMCDGLEVDLSYFGLVHRAKNGNDWLNLLRALYGIKSLSFRGAQANDVWGVMPIPIPFWFPWGNEKMGAPGRPKGSYTAWVVLGTSAEADGFRRAYVADVIKDVEPTEILCTDYYEFTSVAGYVDQVKFTRPGKLIGLLLFDTTPYDSKHFSLRIDGVKIDFDSYLDAEAARKMLKLHGGDWAGGDAADADCDAEKYTFFSFGENPEAWPEISEKEVSLRMDCTTAETKRVIPVLSMPIT